MRDEGVKGCGKGSEADSRAAIEGFFEVIKRCSLHEILIENAWPSVRLDLPLGEITLLAS